MAREVHRLARLGVRLEEVGNGGVVDVDGARSSLVDEVIAKQDLDSSLLELKALVKDGKVEVFSKGEMVPLGTKLSTSQERTSKVGWSMRKIGKVAYELELPSEMDLVHPIFHVSMLRKCVGDPNAIVSLEVVGVVEDNLTYEEVPVQILDRQVKRLRNKYVASIKVLWRNQQVESATWEAEADMQRRYPYPFHSTQA
ncbi:hypothetical protein MTR67_002383 [Solanum verrucosum]|uniref:Tf2-1-like SH3-like domain-containing protein n=1 Tax=Solanum verrucosum TaxID=315347 RepID=A0AAF0PPV0_SOLVR|nr:hypothetical protein MTR67_002383 [Solanum verrucosum]